MSSAPLGQFSASVKGTPASAITLYPEAFSLTYISDQVNDATEADIQAMVDRGEILLVRSWYFSPEMEVIGDMVSKAVFVPPQDPNYMLASGYSVKPLSFLILALIAVLIARF